MAIEIERKFRVRGSEWRSGARGVPIVQGYLAAGPEAVVRVRRAGDEAFLTVKGPTLGLTRLELEYPIPRQDAASMLLLCGTRVVEKTRYRVEHGGHVWEVDEYGGRNAGLLVAEVELASEEQAVELPPWVGDEVSGDGRYRNAMLACQPWTTWGEIG